MKGGDKTNIIKGQIRRKKDEIYRKKTYEGAMKGRKKIKKRARRQRVKGSKKKVREWK